MKKVKNNKKAISNSSQVTLESSLGLLAFGDIAFTAWRKLKKQERNKKNEEK